MKLHEYQSKIRFAQFGVPVQQGEVASTLDEVYRFAEHFAVPVALKAQVLVGERFKANGIRFAENSAEARRIAGEMLGSRIRGLLVNKLLIEPNVAVKRELYLGISNDRTIGRPALIATAAGGVAVEAAALADPESVSREYIEPLIGLRSYQVMRIASNLNLPRELWRELDLIAQALYRCYVDSDATLVEINPLAVTVDDELLALDGKIIVDENALFRQPELAAMRDTSTERIEELRAREAGIAYIRLNGQIGCVVNGAGLAMATMDIINLYGAGSITPANFIDLRGGATKEKVQLALDILLTAPNVKVVLINIFGGMTHCDAVAAGLMAVLARRPSITTPFVVRLQGTRADFAREVLREAQIPGLIFADTLTQAAVHAVDAARELEYGDISSR
ncbi:MAG: ADP-forming succinate--CoA ligase subunit beta [Chloroflexota bacterium]